MHYASVQFKNVPSVESCLTTIQVKLQNIPRSPEGSLLSMALNASPTEVAAILILCSQVSFFTGFFSAPSSTTSAPPGLPCSS